MGARGIGSTHPERATSGVVLRARLRAVMLVDGGHAGVADLSQGILERVFAAIAVFADFARDFAVLLSADDLGGTTQALVQRMLARSTSEIEVGVRNSH